VDKEIVVYTLQTDQSSEVDFASIVARRLEKQYENVDIEGGLIRIGDEKYRLNIRVSNKDSDVVTISLAPANAERHVLHGTMRTKIDTSRGLSL